MKRALKFYIVVCALFCAENLLAETISCEVIFKSSWSEQFKNLESKDSETARENIWRYENSVTNAIFKENPDLKRLQPQIRQIFAIEKTRASYTLKGNRSLKLIDKGVSKGDSIVLEQSGESVELLNSLVLKSNHTLNFISLSLSPDQKYAVVVTSEYGSIDEFKLFVLDIKKRSVATEQPLLASGDGNVSIHWIGQSEFAFSISSGEHKSGLFDAVKKKYSEEDASYSGSYPHTMKYTDAKSKYIGKGDILKRMPDALATRMVATANNNSDLYFVDSLHPNKLYLLKENQSYVRPHEVLKFTGQFEGLNIKENYIFISTTWGGVESLHIFDMRGNPIQHIELPHYAAIEKVEVDKKSNIATISMYNVLGDKFSYDFDLSKQRWIKSPNEVKDMTHKGIRYQSDIVMIPSRDGTEIPTRVTYRSDMPPSKDSAAYMRVYGGFGITGYIRPSRDLEELHQLFLSRGGVLVDPAVRGGNEFGSSWYKDAILKHKTITFEDTIDVANYLATEKIAASAKIILTGTSNGGLVAAASGLLSPQSFGLVIPVNGVLDVLGAKRLNPENDGWSEDYGRSSLKSMAEYIKTYSPLELSLPNPNEIGANFLIVTALDDSRVNSLHGIKLSAKFREVLGRDSSRVRALFLKNNGHWVDSAVYADEISIREKAVIWAYIYKQLGWLP